MPIRPGALLSHYRLVEKIGEGGMGVVWKALDITLGRDVALKILPDDLSADRDRLARLEREARVLASLNHPNIVTIHAVGEDQGVRFLAMELVAGRPLAALIPVRGFDVERVLDIAIPLVSALAAAHEKGIVHRDLKPANIMLSDAGHVKVLDFGIARVQTGAVAADAETLAGTMTRTIPGQIVGTPAFMSPEQIEGRPVDARTDIFAYGVVLYALATGELPFKGDSGLQLISSVLRDVPAPVTTLRPELPEELARVIRRCLEKEPARRYQSALDIRNELDDLGNRLRIEKAIGQAARGTPDAVDAKPAAGRPPARSRAFRRTIVLALIGVAALAAVALVAWSLRGRLFSGNSGIRSLAVLPLANQMGDANQDYLVDGIHDALITEIARLGTVKVISRTSVMRFRKPDRSITQIASELGADAIVEGSVLRIGNRLRVNTQLIDGHTDSHLWAKVYERDVGDLAGLLGQVTQAIAGQIGAAISPRHQARLARSESVRPEVQDLYLRGRQKLNVFTPAAVADAAALFEQAIAAEPGYARAYAGLAICRAYPVLFGNGAMPAAVERARAAAVKAIELDEELGEAHTALAMIKFYFDWDWEGAGREVRRAVELNSADWMVYRPLSDYLLVTGDLDGAVAAARRGREVDPLSFSNRASVVSRLAWARRYAEAVTEGQLLIKSLGPNASPSYLAIAHLSTGISLWWAGRQRDAIEQFRGMWSDQEMSGLLDAGVSAGGPPEAMRRVAHLLDENAVKSGRVANAYTIALFHAMGGEHDAALPWLERMCDERHRDVSHIGLDIAFDPLHTHPRFVAILDRLKLPK